MIQKYIYCNNDIFVVFNYINYNKYIYISKNNYLTYIKKPYILLGYFFTKKNLIYNKQFIIILYI